MLLFSEKKDALSRFSGDSKLKSFHDFFPARHHRREPQERGALQSVHGKFPDNRYKEQLRSGIHRLLYRPAPLFHRGVPRTRPDLQRPAQGETETLLYGLGTRGLRHGGTGCLFRYHPLHDAARHIRHQRCREGHRIAAPPFAGRILRAERTHQRHQTLLRTYFRSRGRGSSSPRTSTT